MNTRNPAPKKRNPLPQGVTPLDQVKHLNGLEFMQGILEGRFPPPPISEPGLRTRTEHARYSKVI